MADYKYNLFINDKKYILCLNETENELFINRRNRKFVKYCSLERLIEKIDLATSDEELEDIIEKNDMCDAYDLKGYNIYMAKSMLKCIANILYKYPYTRSELCYIGTSVGFVQRLKKMVNNDIATIKDFKLQHILSYKNIKGLIKLFFEYKSDYKLNGIIAYYAFYFSLFSGIIFNNNIMLDYDLFKENMRENIKIGHNNKESYDERGICYHELAHAIDNAYGITTNKSFIAYYKTLSKDDIEKGVSAYALTDIREFFAESFLEYNMTKMPRLIATNVKAIVDFIMKTRGKR